MAEADRKKIDEMLLRERLGLDDDWLHRDDNGVAHLPMRLPSFIKPRLHSEMVSLESAINRLVSAGCRRQALYFCLQELSPGTERSRRGLGWMYDRTQPSSDPEVSYRTELKLAPKQDVQDVAAHAEKALQTVRKYNRELLLVYDTLKPSIPVIFADTVDKGPETLNALLALLAWVRDLATSYVAPFETTLLKSKRLLYPTVYVSMYADAEKLKSALQRGGSERDGTHVRKQRPKKRDFRPEHALAQIANICTGHHWAPSDLSAKLKTFEKDYPALHKKMKAKMTALHRAAAE